jgi:hypothetical protein
MVLTGIMTMKPKFEMCNNILAGHECVHGSKCRYAHCPNELVTDYETLLTVGHVSNITTDRNLLCFDFLITGDCPFGSRCSRLHDQRWINEKAMAASWLEHKEMPFHKYQEEDGSHSVVPVDNFYHLIQDAMYEGGQVMRRDSFREVYNSLLSRVTFDEGQWHCTTSSFARDRELVILEVAIAMRENESHATKSGGGEPVSFTYQPDHLLCGLPCMVLQTQQVLARGSPWFVVHKIAFSPAGKDANGGKLPPVALWFDLPSESLIKDVGGARDIHSRASRLVKNGGCSSKSCTRSKAQNVDKLVALLRDHLVVAEGYDYDKDVFRWVLDCMNLRKKKVERGLSMFLSLAERDPHFLFSPAQGEIGIANMFDEEAREAQELNERFMSLQRFHRMSCPTLEFCMRDNGTQHRPTCSGAFHTRGVTTNRDNTGNHVSRFTKTLRDTLSQDASVWKSQKQESRLLSQVIVPNMAKDLNRKLPFLGAFNPQDHGSREDWCRSILLDKYQRFKEKKVTYGKTVIPKSFYIGKYPPASELPLC